MFTTFLVLFIFHSAGVGRTGTYIAVDTIIRLLDRPNDDLPRMKLDVMDIVYTLRRDRVKMVQTKVRLSSTIEENMFSFSIGTIYVG
jgi:protein tyrosine phosphatase